MRVALCDENNLLLDVLGSAIRAGGHEVVARTPAPAAAVAATRTHQPDLCFIEVVFTDGSGVDAIASMTAASPRTKVILLTDSRDERLIGRARAAGAVGVINKAQSLADLFRTLDAYRQELPNTRFTRIPAQRSWTDRISPGDPGWALRFLTPREWEVLDDLVAGDSTEQIARRMGVRHATARGHIQNLMDKLGVHSRLQATALLESTLRGERRPMHQH